MSNNLYKVMAPLSKERNESCQSQTCLSVPRHILAGLARVVAEQIKRGCQQVSAHSENPSLARQTASGTCLV